MFVFVIYVWVFLSIASYFYYYLQRSTFFEYSSKLFAFFISWISLLIVIVTNWSLTFIQVELHILISDVWSLLKHQYQSSRCTVRCKRVRVRAIEWPDFANTICCNTHSTRKNFHPNNPSALNFLFFLSFTKTRFFVPSNYYCSPTLPLQHPTTITTTTTNTDSV